MLSTPVIASCLSVDAMVSRFRMGKNQIDISIKDSGLQVSNGYSDVSFVSSLSNTILKTDTSAAQVSERVKMGDLLLN